MSQYTTLCGRRRSALRFLNCTTSSRICQELFSLLPKLWLFRSNQQFSKQAYLVTMPVVTASGLVWLYWDYITYPRICQEEISFPGSWRSARCKRLFFGSLVQSALCAPVSATSARVTLVTLTVGFMALFICPGFPRWTSIGSPVHEIEKVHGLRMLRPRIARFFSRWRGRPVARVVTAIFKGYRFGLPLAVVDMIPYHIRFVNTFFTEIHFLFYALYENYFLPMSPF